VDLPGVGAHDVHVRVRPWQIEICGRREAARSARAARRVLVERTVGRFCRTFRLEHEVDPDATETRCEHGVCRIRLRKRGIADHDEDVTEEDES